MDAKNYPADAHAERLVRADGHSVPAVLDAVLSVMSLDRDVDSAFRPCAYGDCARMEPIYDEFVTVIGTHEPGVTLRSLEGASFYDRGRGCYAIVAAGEPRLFGNIVLRKVVIQARNGTQCCQSSANLSPKRG